MENTYFITFRNILEGLIKFPKLKKGEIAIQVGFDLSSKNLVTDVLVMLRRVGKEGMVIAIDPDPSNHNKLQPITQKAGYNVRYIQKATFSENSSEKLELALRASQNKLGVVQGKIPDKQKSGKFIEVELSTLDTILKNLNVDIKKVSEIHITNNGAEYQTLLGMEKILSEAENISIHLRCGRAGGFGQINGTLDYELIEQYLTKFGFETRFYRITDLFYWWMSKLILKKEWWFGKKEKPQGVVIATKGNKKMGFFQSYA